MTVYYYCASSYANACNAFNLVRKTHRSTIVAERDLIVLAEIASNDFDVKFENDGQLPFIFTKCLDGENAKLPIPVMSDFSGNFEPYAESLIGIGLSRAEQLKVFGRYFGSGRLIVDFKNRTVTCGKKVFDFSDHCQGDRIFPKTRIIYP